LYFHKGRKAKTEVLRAQKEKLVGVGRGQMEAQKQRCLAVPRQQKYNFFQNYAKGKKFKITIWEMCRPDRSKAAKFKELQIQMVVFKVDSDSCK